MQKIQANRSNHTKHSTLSYRCQCHLRGAQKIAAIPVIVQHHHIHQTLRQLVRLDAHKAHRLIELRIDGLVHGARSKPFRLLHGAVFGDNVHLAEGVRQTGRVHGGQIAGAHNGTVERVIGFAVADD